MSWEKNKALSIINWDSVYENSESRKIRSCSYICLPNKHDGKGFRRIAAHSKSHQVFAGCVLILQVASKMPQRGLLVDEDGALDANDLAAVTGFDESVFELAAEVMTQPKVRWAEWVDIPSTISPNGKTQDTILVHREAIPARPDALGRTEQKGTKQNGMEGNISRTCAREGAHPQEVSSDEHQLADSQEPLTLESEPPPKQPPYPGDSSPQQKDLLEPPKQQAVQWCPQHGWANISEADLSCWKQAFPACDINRQLAAMDAWLRANPAKARKSNWPRFINNWLTRAQDKGGDQRSLNPPTRQTHGQRPQQPGRNAGTLNEGKKYGNSTNTGDILGRHDLSKICD